MSQREDTTLAEAQQFYHSSAISDPEGQRKILLDKISQAHNQLRLPLESL